MTISGGKVKDNLPAGCKSAAVLSELMEKANAVLDHHPINEARRKNGDLPANAIWFWAEGTAAALPDFTKQYGKTRRGRQRRSALFTALRK